MTWKTDSLSPNGNWLATASSREGGGFGGSYDVTDVFLKWKTSSQPIQILGFSHDQPTMKLRLDWIDSTHLHVTYGSHAVLNFQAVKCDGVEITVQDVSSEF